MSRPKILLADDHTMVAQALAHYLKEDFDLVGIVDDGQKLIRAVRELRPDVVITDIAMPVMDGVEALRQLRAQGETVRIILLTMHAEAELACQALRAGAAGYLLKHSAGEELVAAIGQVMQGNVYISPLIARDVVRAMSLPAGRGATDLTQRQRDVLRLVAGGLTMKEVAAELNLSPRTVEAHKYEMMETLGVRSTAELVRYALRHGISPT